MRIADTPQIQEVACDRLVYFYHPEGLKGLANAIAEAHLKFG